MKEVKDIQFPIQVITNIHYVNLHEDTQDLNPRLEKFIRNTGDQMKRSTNLKADMTWFNVESKEFEELQNIIKPYLAKFFINDNTEKTLCMTPEFVETWGALYNKDDYTVTHVHEPCKLSWIYYVKVSENTAPLYIHQIVNEGGKREVFKIPPKISDLVMFPSWTPHSVPKQKIDEERICVAGNVNLTWDKKDKRRDVAIKSLSKRLDLPI
tara:strand:+ start:98 stop:730 length:633 start_codon:yes stop_codon:yes gene_type:complete